MHNGESTSSAPIAPGSHLNRTTAADLTMGDAGEGLVDAEARIQERMDDLEAERRRRSNGRRPIDAEKIRKVESLRLAKSNLERQAETAAHPVRKQQIQLAIDEIDKRLAEM
jgi:hypothetical protein